MTDSILQTAADWTGARPLTCPWRAFYDPFVRRVQHAYRFFESGNLAVFLPNPSHRLMEGISHMHSVQNRISHHLHEQDRKERERKQVGR